MPFVNIRLVKEVLGDDASAKKQAMTDKIADVISTTMGIDQEAVQVVYEDVTEGDWFVGNQSVKKMRGSS